MGLRYGRLVCRTVEILVAQRSINRRQVRRRASHPRGAGVIPSQRWAGQGGSRAGKRTCSPGMAARQGQGWAGCREACRSRTAFGRSVAYRMIWRRPGHEKAGFERAVIDRGRRRRRYSAMDGLGGVPVVYRGRQTGSQCCLEFDEWSSQVSAREPSAVERISQIFCNDDAASRMDHSEDVLGVALVAQD